MPTTILTSQAGSCRVFNQVVSGQAGGFRTQNAALVGFCVWVGSGELPDLTTPPTAFSQTLPLTEALTPPGSGTLTYYAVVRQRDSYGLVSQNQYPTTITINSAGTLILPPMTPPVLVFISQITALGLLVVTSYPGLVSDPVPGNYWRVWAGTVPPDPAVDAPVVTSAITRLNAILPVPAQVAGPCYVAVGIYRSQDQTISNTASDSITISGGLSPIVPV